LIEYVERVVNLLKAGDLESSTIHTAVLRFVKHHVWHVKEQYEQQLDNPLWK